MSSPVVITTFVRVGGISQFLDGALPTKTTKSTPRVATSGGGSFFSGGGTPNCRHVAACAFAMTCAGPFGVEVCLDFLHRGTEKLTKIFWTNTSGVKEIFSRVIQHEKQYLKRSKI